MTKGAKHMKRIFTGGWMAICVVVMLAGCITSLNPTYTEDALRFDEDLLGAWKAEQGDSVWTFERDGDMAYRLSYTFGVNKFVYKARLTELAGHAMLDLEWNKEASVIASDDIPDALIWDEGHGLVRVLLEPPILYLSFPDPEWFDDYLRDHPDAVTHRRTTKGIMLTAPTEEVRAFFAEHIDHPDAFRVLPPFHRSP